jgi:hypothetical protein
MSDDESSAAFIRLDDEGNPIGFLPEGHGERIHQLGAALIEALAAPDVQHDDEPRIRTVRDVLLDLSLDESLEASYRYEVAVEALELVTKYIIHEGNPWEWTLFGQKFPTMMQVLAQHLRRTDTEFDGVDV